MDQFQPEKDEIYPGMLDHLWQDIDEIGKVQDIIYLHSSILENILETPFQPKLEEIEKMIQEIGQELKEIIQQNDILQRNLSAMLNKLKSLKRREGMLPHNEGPSKKLEKVIQHLKKLAKLHEDRHTLTVARTIIKMKEVLSKVQDEMMHGKKYSINLLKDTKRPTRRNLLNKAKNMVKRYISKIVRSVLYYM